MSELPRDLARTPLAVLFLGGLILASFWIIRPFLAPLMCHVEKRLWGSRALAATAM